MKNESLTGIVFMDDETVMFATQKDDFEFSFLTNRIYSIVDRNEVVKIPSNDGFIYGKTHNGNNIAIWAGDSGVEVLGSGILNTSAYVKSESNISESSIEYFDGIKFKGGILKKAFHIKGIDTERKDGNIIVTYNNDTLEYEIKTKEYEFTMRIRSNTREKHSTEGVSIDNTEVVLDVWFKKSQPLRSVFKHYNTLKDFFSFLVFRDEVEFENIKLLKKDSETGQMVECAAVFIKNDVKLPKKHKYQCICLDDLGKTVPELLRLFYDTEDKKTAIMLGFLPLNDEDLYKMNNTKLRAVCTALESELGFVENINMETNAIVINLVEQVKNTVKKFREENNGLSNDMYNYIFSNIKTWSYPLAERICALYREYTKEIEKMNNTNVPVTEESIRKFVKYRNDITHGKHRILDLEIAVTAHCMCGLVYCCILNRVGLERDTILELSKYKLLK